MTTPGGNTTLSYMPQPYEQAYYLGLFNTADSERKGAIGGATAVQFFSRSKLPVDVLKSVWIAADNPPTSVLDHRKFAVAVRLIQLIQNGLKGQGASLEVPPGVVLRPAFFDGVSGVLVPLPQQPPIQSQAQSQPQQQQPPSTPMQQPAPTSAPGPPQSPPLQPTQLNSSQSLVLQPATPPRPPQSHVAPGVPPVGYGALTVQDPYTLTPSEHARYEQLFKDVCKEDGYCYGAEAVAFFSKSGLQQQQLSAIWNMSDYPVDNRLDKIEFSIAMHLIVCVSKKNLPLPPSLPFALKQLKAQMPPPQTVRMPSPSPGLGQPQMAPAEKSTVENGMGNSFNPPNTGFSTVISPNIETGTQYSTTVAQKDVGAVDDNLQSTGGLSGLRGPPPLQSASGSVSISDAFEGLVTGGDTETISTYRVPTPPPVHVTNSFDTHNNSYQAPTNTQNRVPTPVPDYPQSVSLSPAKPKETSNSNQRHRDTDELRLALQKLQAENISLKARLSTMNGEEEDVRSELVQTVSEITKLSSELTTLRAQVLAAKSRLLEVTGELTAAKEKKKVVKDLIDEAQSTKTAIEDATKSIESAKEAMINSNTPASITNYEADLFDWGSGEVAASASVSVPAPVPVPDPAHATNQPYSVSNTSTVSFDGTSNYTSGTYSLSDALRESASKTNSSSQYKPPEVAATFSFNQQDTSPFNQQDTSSFLPKMQLNREPSVGFGEIMGGSSGLQSITPAPAALNAQSSKSEAEENDVDTLKQKAKAALDSLREAENVASDAEATKQQVVAQATELRRLADEAEKLSREVSSAASGKKKGLFGRGQKHDAKEAEKLAAEARDKKEAFLQAQSQVNDAMSLANETKKEVERLRKVAEDLELKAASAESMQKPTPSTEAPSNGFTSQAPSFGFGTVPNNRPSSNDSFGAQPYGMGLGFDANVMGSGGMSIPTPSGVSDPYENPF